MTSFHIGIDIGGTFTDCVAIGDDGVITSAKTLSTHGTTPAEGVLEGVRLLGEARGLTTDELLAATARFSHGTTIGTNLVVERNGARVGLLATKGHGDAFRIMRGGGRTAGVAADLLFDAHREGMPEPLVPKRWIMEIEERIDSRGEVVARLNEGSVREAVKRLLAEGVEAVAVALLWSVANPAHERRVREIVREMAPQLYVSLSSEVSPRQGEYERTVAAVIDSYVGPASVRYLEDLSGRLTERGLRTPPFILQASGGVVPVENARRQPFRTIGSGPAGGLAGALSIARSRGDSHVIATDMGGTSFEVGLIVDGRMTLASEQVIDKYTFYSTHIDLRSIACGGGSIAHADRQSGALRVGPQSAGSVPGPACYGKGERPTVTDADLVLGLLDAETFLGGRMQLDLDRARRAIAAVGEPFGLSVEETAAGIVQINAHAAATLIRQRTIEQGLDPRDFTIYAYGGAGPVHAFAFAGELGVEKVVIPLGNGASTLSAYGAASSDLLQSFERQITLASPFEADRLADVVAELEDRALAAMVEGGVSRDEVVFERLAIMRYADQYLQELNVPIPSGPIDAATTQSLADAFTREYARLYSEAALALFQTIEISQLRVSARVASKAGQARGGAGDTIARSSAPTSSRSVYWPGQGRLTTAIHAKPLVPGERVRGPAIIELPHTSVAVAAGQAISVEETGTLTLYCRENGKDGAGEEALAAVEA